MDATTRKESAKYYDCCDFEPHSYIIIINEPSRYIVIINESPSCKIIINIKDPCRGRIQYFWLPLNDDRRLQLGRPHFKQWQSKQQQQWQQRQHQQQQQSGETQISNNNNNNNRNKVDTHDKLSLWRQAYCNKGFYWERRWKYSLSSLQLHLTSGP